MLSVKLLLLLRSMEFYKIFLIGSLFGKYFLAFYTLDTLTVWEAARVFGGHHHSQTITITFTF